MAKVFSKKITGNLGNPEAPHWTGNGPGHEDSNTVWKKDEHNELSHTASSTNNKPSWWDNQSAFSENSVSHSMVAAWNYCDGKKSYVKLDGKIVLGEFFEDEEQ